MGTYIRLIDYKYADEKCKQFKNKNNYSVMGEEQYSKIPGYQYAYWISENALNNFKKNNLNNYVSASVGIQTGDNDKFLRFWWEVIFENIKFDTKNVEDSFQKCKWFPYNKGGEYRRWYGNDYMVINWKNDGEDIKENSEKTGHHYQQYTDNMKFKPLVTWSRIATGTPAFRIKGSGYLSDMAGFSLYGEPNILKRVLGFCNSCVAKYYLDFLAPTLNIMTAPVLSLPFDIKDTNGIDEIVDEIIKLSKEDWDNFEISWNFKSHTLMKYIENEAKLISNKYEQWVNKSEDRFLKIKKNEERINEIFIEIYGLEKEMEPSVPDDAISLRKANLEREIKSLISYAVGCIMGRYSLKEEGLIYAGGEWDDSKYPDDFRPCEYGIMPITDEQFFEEDLCTRVIDFIKVVYGEDTLSENLKFIAKALNPNSYEAPRKIIRDYLFNDFFDNHYQIYQHRPIYWQLDSGKAGGFKAILYMHRYNENSLSIVRTEYIQELRYKYEDEMQRLQRRHADAKTTVERNAVKREITALDRKIVECSAYDELLNHVTGNIHNYSFDLDDGVKTNYAKFLSIDGDKNKNILTVIKL